MGKKYFFVFLILFFSIKILPGQDPIALTKPGHEFGKTEIEKEWFPKVERIFEDLDFNGYLLEDDSLVNYVNEIVQKVMPVKLKAFDVKAFIVEVPNINAGMYLNGNLIINTGALAAYDNEAQLAYVICHELAHFINRHSLRKLEIDKVFRKKAKSRKKKIRAILFQSEYSQNLELEADSLGLELFLAANYKPEEAIFSLQKLPASAAPPTISKKLKRIFSILPQLPTHPLQEDRINDIKSILAKKNLPNQGIVNAARYQRLTKNLPKLNLELLRNTSNSPLKLLPKLDTLQASISDTTSLYFREIKLMRGELHIEALEDPLGTGLSIVMSEAQLGDELYKMYKQGKLEGKAARAFNQIKPELEERGIEILKSLFKDEDLGHRAHRAVGLIYAQLIDVDKAVFHLEKYLNSGNKILDKRYINSVLSELE